MMQDPQNTQRWFTESEVRAEIARVEAEWTRRVATILIIVAYAVAVAVILNFG